MDLPLLGTLASGQSVFDRHDSHLHGEIVNLLSEAFGKIFLTGEQFSVQEVDLGRIVGETICVSTSVDDEIVFAKRPKRAGLTRFVKNRQPNPTSSVVVILKAMDEGGYILITTFAGSRSEPEPWDRNATEKSVEFWNTHALLWGKEEIIPGTETSVCPW